MSLFGLGHLPIRDQWKLFVQCLMTSHPDLDPRASCRDAGGTLWAQRAFHKSRQGTTVPEDEQKYQTTLIPGFSQVVPVDERRKHDITSVCRSAAPLRILVKSL